MNSLCKYRLFFALAAVCGIAWPGALPAAPQSSAPREPAAAPRPPKPDVRRARKAYERGLHAEQARDWPAAFAAYSEAVTYSSRDAELLLKREAARSRVVRQHSDQAERAALAGSLDQAGNELRVALEVDPTNSVIRERLAQFEASAPPPQQKSPPTEDSGTKLGGPVQLQPQPGVRDFDHRGDARTAYEEVARQFGVAASFDPDLPARLVRLRLTGVDFRTAMDLLARQTNTFWRALDRHTFFVAENSAAKRREYAPEVVRTVTLPNSATPERMTEVSRLVREMAGIAKVDLDTRTRTITLRDTSENVAVAMALIEQLEQAPAEMMLEIELLEINRDAARKLGVTPPSAAQIFTISSADARAAAQAKTLSELLAIAQRIFGPTIPPVVAFGGGRTLFFATLPGAAADFSETLSLVRSGQRMMLRAQDGFPATFFVGERFPVALAVLQASLVSGQLSSTVSQVVFPRADFATGTAPAAMVAADFNGDGRTDLAVVNKGSNSVSILLGNPDGSFGTRTDFPTGTNPVAIATGDFNGDGRLDLAVVNQSVPPTVSILLGNGDGTFGAKTDFPTGASPVAIVAQNFNVNVDTKLDLAIVNQTDNTVSILLGNGDGTFKPRTDFPTGAGPSAIAFGDFNADGRLDLAVTNQTAGTVSILLGNGDGTFKPRTDFPTGGGPSAVVAADFNGDARPDLAIANQTDNTVSLLTGNGDGTFATKGVFSTGTTPVALASGDFNGDARLDLAVANQGSNTVSILVGNGDGTFSNRLDVGVGNAPSSLAAGDFNNDGRLDLAITNRDSNTVSVILNSSAFSAASAASLSQSAFPGAEYEDLGLKIRATPRIHIGDEVTLRMEFEIRALSGESINGIPVISNRTIDQTLRLRENETTVLSGIIQENEAKTITGLPGFARTPGAGYLAGRRNTQATNSELLILITPRRIRLGPRQGRTIYAGRGEPTPAGGRTGP